VAGSSPGGIRNLLQHEVDIGDHFGDGMFDPGCAYHLDEIEFAVLDRNSIVPTPRYSMPAWLGAGRTDLCARCRGKYRDGLPPDLLMAALQRTIALAEMDGAAAASPSTYFDLARLLADILR